MRLKNNKMNNENSSITVSLAMYNHKPSVTTICFSAFWYKSNYQ